MANSSPLGKQFIKSWVKEQKDIKVILDMGAGCGTYRTLLGPKYYWKGVEIWKMNIKKYKLNERYDKIYHANIRSHFNYQADLVIFGDVLEHLPKEDALETIDYALQHYPHMVISIPLGDYPQGAIENNPFEEHKSTWSYDELNALAPWERTCTLAINPLLPTVMQIGVFIK